MSPYRLLQIALALFGAIFLFVLMFIPVGLIIWGVFIDDSLRSNSVETIAHVNRLHESRGRSSTTGFPRLVCSTSPSLRPMMSSWRRNPW